MIHMHFTVLQRHFYFFLMLVFLLSACATTKNYTPLKKYDPATLQSDFKFMQRALQQKHPSLYWYTPKDSMDKYFKLFGSAIRDSLTEQQFIWKVLAPMVATIHCGHTSLGYSKPYSKWLEGRRLSSFPYYVRVWNDSMAITASLLPKDSSLPTGTLITGINGIRNRQLIAGMFRYLPMDGYAANVNYQRLSANFPRYLGNIYGLSKNYNVTYIDSTGKEQLARVPLFEIKRDSTKKDSLLKTEKPVRATPLPRSARLKKFRNFEIDSSKKFATLTLNSFTKGNLRGFFRKSFRGLRKQDVENLIIDLRINGGGRVNLSTLLTKYISRQPFKVADSVYSKTKFTFPYARHLQNGIWQNFALLFMTHKAKDGNYHVGYMERKLFKPKKKNHVNANVYVLINGATFSASTVFCNAVKGQEGITLLGEETGGGWYGNSGIFIPDLTLPETGIRLRFPLFRLVQYNHVAFKGTGVPPDVFVPVNYPALLQKVDKKMEVVKEIIFSKGLKKDQ